MRRSFARIRGLGYILWHGRHMGYHVLLGLVWAWFLRELWGEFNPRWVTAAVVGSLLPDIDHILYFFGHGRGDEYTRQIRAFLRERKWRMLTLLMEKGHKNNTNLSYHNYYFMTFLLGVALVSSRLDWEAGVTLFGAMVIHYLLDITDDIFQLGMVNPNWKRWGRPRRQ